MKAPAGGLNWSRRPGPVGLCSPNWNSRKRGLEPWRDPLSECVPGRMKELSRTAGRSKLRRYCVCFLRQNTQLWAAARFNKSWFFKKVMGSVDSRRCGQQNWNVRDKKLQNEVLKYEIGGVLDEVGLETSFQRRRKFGRERPKNRRKIRDHVARGGAYTPYFELDLFEAVVAGGRSGHLLNTLCLIAWSGWQRRRKFNTFCLMAWAAWERWLRLPS